MDPSPLVFLKLGGSLITDKMQSMTPRLDVIERLASEIAAAVKALPGLRLLIGHGSGSFGHDVANRHRTQFGGNSPAYWQGFSAVWQAARALNQLIAKALARAGLPVIVFPPSAGIIVENHQVLSWDLQPIKQALERGLVPVVYGDVVFDLELGGTILSTEDLFFELAKPLRPQKILLAGLDQGVYSDPQKPEAIIPVITPQSFPNVRSALSASQAVDVTGGMLSKVETMLSLISDNPSLEVIIFSGAVPGNLQKALIDVNAIKGTLITQGATSPGE